MSDYPYTQEDRTPELDSIAADAGADREYDEMIISRIAALEAQNKKLVEGLQLLSEYKNYATEGNVETSGGVVHVSEFAAALLSEVTQ